jgi:uncharacterized protein YndB with AHSA1/START domain
MSYIEKLLWIDAPIQRVWGAITNPDDIAEWMFDETVSVDLRLGGHYALFDQQTTGQFTLIEAPQLVEYTWRQSAWPQDWADSIVRWELQAEGQQTHVRLLHGNFPTEAELHGHDEGWDVYWLGPMKDWLEDVV